MKIRINHWPAILAVAVCTMPASINATPLIRQDTETKEVQLTGNFAAGKKDKIAKDLSGIACKPDSQSTSLKCIVINDESTKAQLIRIENNNLIVGAEIELLKDLSPKKTYGKQPRIACKKGLSESNEFDGEGVAYREPHFYLVGSHGCSRRKGEFRPTSYLLVRLDVDDNAWNLSDRTVLRYGQNKVVRSLEATYRLVNDFRRSLLLRPFLGKDLGEIENGLNIEGITIVNAQLITGLRAPSDAGTAFLVISDLRNLFAPGRANVAKKSDVRRVSVESGTGIRDLAFLEGNMILVLTGPAQEQPAIPYRILELELANTGGVRQSKPMVVAAAGDAKAEGLTVLTLSDQKVETLILFDGVKNGGPIKFGYTRK